MIDSWPWSYDGDTVAFKHGFVRRADRWLWAGWATRTYGELVAQAGSWNRKDNRDLSIKNVSVLLVPDHTAVATRTLRSLLREWPMTASQKAQHWIDLGLASGVAAGVLYAVGMLNLIPGKGGGLAFMLFGPCLLISAAGLRHFYARANDSVSNDLAHLMIACAGLAFTFMATMQMSIYTLIPRYAREVTLVDTPTWDAVLRSVSSTQLGLDFAFDIFVSIGTVLLGWQMVRHPRIWSSFGVVGMVIGIAGLTVNAATFPDNSGDAGLIDPAPFFGLWMGLSVVPVIRRRRWTRSEAGGLR